MRPTGGWGEKTEIKMIKLRKKCYTCGTIKITVVVNLPEASNKLLASWKKESKVEVDTTVYFLQ